MRPLDASLPEHLVFLSNLKEKTLHFLGVFLSWREGELICFLLWREFWQQRCSRIQVFSSFAASLDRTILLSSSNLFDDTCMVWAIVAVVVAALVTVSIRQAFAFANCPEGKFLNSVRLGRSGSELISSSNINTHTHTKRDPICFWPHFHTSHSYGITDLH